MSRDPTISKGLPRDLKVLARSRSPYNDIFVIQNGDLREMWFKGGMDFYLQSRIDVRQPHSPILVYSKMVFSSLLFQPQPKRVLVIGLGGGVLPNCLARWYPDCTIDVVDVDPKVIDLARRYFFLETSPSLQVFAEDGRLFLKRRRGPYDLIILDAFKSGSIPYHLKTEEFYMEIAEALSPDGILATNLYGKSNTLKPHDWKTLTTVFPQLYFFEDEEKVATVCIAARHDTPWSAETLREKAASFNETPGWDLDFSALAALQVPNEYAHPGARVFKDDFREQDLTRVFEKNNRGESRGRVPYPISNVH